MDSTGTSSEAPGRPRASFRVRIRSAFVQANIGVDGSPSSRQALRWAARQAELTGDELHAVIAWSFPDVYAWVPVNDGIDWAVNAEEALEQAISGALVPATAERVQRHVIEGYPARVLLDAAADADLLVVGSRGHGGFTGMLLGSVSQHAVTHARYPVVVIHDADTPPASTA
jgi:nucleotide-binding universal stress UspA family protein